MPWPQTGARHYHVKLELLDKGRAIKGLVVCNNKNLEALDLLSVWPWGMNLMVNFHFNNIYGPDASS